MDRRTIVIFFVALAVYACLTKPHVLSWNDGSRFATVDALVTDGTFAIEQSRFAVAIEDKYPFGGHMYSDKPPALALIGAGIARIVAPAGVTFTRTPGTAIYVVTLGTVGIWFALGCAYTFALARRLDVGVRAATAAATLAGLGTLALPYATVFSNHVPAGAAALAGCYHLVRVREGAGHAVFGGLFLALMVAFDAGAFALTLTGVVLLWGAAPQRWAVALAAALPIVALQLAYNLHVSDALIPPALNAASWSDPSSPFHKADPSIFAFAGPREYAAYAVYVLVGAKGLLAYTPLVLICGYGFALMLRGRPNEQRLAIAILAATGVYLATIVVFTNDYGALNYGERRYADASFLLCIGLGPALTRIRGSVAIGATRVLIVASVVSAALGTLVPFGGTLGSVSFVVAAQEFVALMHRAPVAAAGDIIGLALALGFAVWISSTEGTRAPRVSSAVRRA